MPTAKNEKAAKTKNPNIIEVLKGDLNKIKGKAAKGPRKDRASLWGKVGFGLGIVSAGAWLIPLLGIPVAIAGLVFNLLGLRVEKGRWFAVAGLTLSMVFLNVAFIFGFYSLLISMFASAGI